MTTIKRQIAQSAEGFPLLGNVIYWSTKELREEYTNFVKTLQDIGIDSDLAPKPQLKTAILRAIQEEVSVRGNCFYKSFNQKDSVLFVIVSTAMQAGQNDVDLNKDTKVLFDKKTGVISVDGFNSQSVVDRYAQWKGIYDEDNLRGVALNFIGKYCEAVSVRESGGVYFVPEHKIAIFEKLQQLFAKYNKCSLDLIPVIDTAAARHSMWKVLVGEVEGEIESLSKDLEELDQDVKGKERSLSTRLSKYDALKSKVENYSVLMSGTAGELTAKIDDLTKKLKNKLG